MRLFTGLHRMVIVVAVCAAVSIVLGSYSDFSKYQARKTDYENLFTNPLIAEVDGKKFAMPMTLPVERMDVGKFVESLDTPVDKAKIIDELQFDWWYRKELISYGPPYDDRPLMIALWLFAGPAVYLAGMCLLLVGRWIIRGFLTPPNDQTDAAPGKV